MKRILTFAILALLSFSLASSNLAEDSFMIKAYKISPSATIEFVVVDALHSYLDTISGTGREIDLTDHLSSYLSNNPVIEDATTQIIFSYRLAGSANGKHKINFTFDAFKEYGVADNPHPIDAYYEMDNMNFVFSGNIPDGASYSGTYNTPKGVLFSDGVSSSPTMEQELTVTSNGSIPWIFRGAIMMAISKPDFDAAPLGTYKANITATYTAP